MDYNPSGGPGEASRIASIRDKYAAQLMSIDGVEGVAIGQDSIGNDALVVYLRSESVKGQIPSEIEGRPVVTEVTGHIDAYGARPGL
jgi:hypothetical protein